MPSCWKTTSISILPICAAMKFEARYFKKHPELKDVLKKLSGTISDQDMAQMNYAVESEGKEPRAVAEKFLQDAGLLK